MRKLNITSITMWMGAIILLIGFIISMLIPDTNFFIRAALGFGAYSLFVANSLIALGKSSFLLGGSGGR